MPTRVVALSGAETLAHDRASFLSFRSGRPAVPRVMPEDRSKPFQAPRIQEAAIPGPPKGPAVAVPQVGLPPVAIPPATGTVPTPARPSVAPRGSIPPRQSIPPRPSMIDLDWLAEDTSGGRATETSLPIPVPLQKANRASLTLITGLNAGQVFPLDQADVVIGRSREAHVRIDDVGISRQHSRIVCSID